MPAAAISSVSGDIVVFRAESGRLWRWDGGAQTRPGIFASFAAAEGFEVDPVTLKSVQVRWHGGGEGYSGDARVSGAELRVWDQGEWSVVAQNGSAALGAFDDVSWCAVRRGEDPPAGSCIERASLRELFTGERGELHVGATPVAPNATREAQLRTDYIEATVRYRLE